MAGWNNHSYLFTQQTPRLTFNGYSLCSVSKYPGEFDFHYCVENIHSPLLLSSLGLHEDAGLCINDEEASGLGGGVFRVTMELAEWVHGPDSVSASLIDRI